MDILTGLDLAKAIKQMRLNRGLTQVKVSEAIGVSTFTLIRWEQGNRSPDGVFLQKLASTLGYAMVLSTEGLWSCYPDDTLSEGEKSSMKKPESVNEIYRKATEAKDKAVWNVFFNKLVRNNPELEAWFRKSEGGRDIDEKKFKLMSDVILAMIKSDQ